MLLEVSEISGPPYRLGPVAFSEIWTEPSVIQRRRGDAKLTLKDANVQVDFSEVWLTALKMADDQIRHLGEHSWYDKHGAIDPSYKAHLISAAQRRRARIFAAGESDWQQRYERLQKPE